VGVLGPADAGELVAGDEADLLVPRELGQQQAGAFVRRQARIAPGALGWIAAAPGGRSGRGPSGEHGGCDDEKRASHETPNVLARYPRRAFGGLEYTTVFNT
jgi:hypothetical protein